MAQAAIGGMAPPMRQFQDQDAGVQSWVPVAIKRWWENESCCASRRCFDYVYWNISNYNDLTRPKNPKGSEEEGTSLFQGNLGWWKWSNLARWCVSLCKVRTWAGRAYTDDELSRRFENQSAGEFFFSEGLSQPELNKCPPENWWLEDEISC